MPFVTPLSVVRAFCLPVLLLISGMAHTALAQSNDQNADAQKGRVILEARMTENDSTIERGLEWRIFSTTLNQSGKLSLLAQAKGGTKAFDITSGEYFVHVAYGHAGVVKRVNITPGSTVERFVLNAGGLQLNANAAIDTPIAPRLLRFDVYSDARDETSGERELIATGIKANEIVPFPVGTYHVVSRFGKLNAEVRADLRVQAGKVTRATLQHRAARLTFRLVRNSGGDAIADTAWSILTDVGDVISESSSAFPSMVLAEGNYSAIAKNQDLIYSRNFKVESGINTDVEVLTQN